jgi:hypothetical protein
MELHVVRGFWYLNDLGETCCALLDLRGLHTVAGGSTRPIYPCRMEPVRLCSYSTFTPWTCFLVRFTNVLTCQFVTRPVT